MFGEAQPAESAPGTQIAGKFWLRELLGGGGFGEVWRAEHRVGQEQARPCAVKLLRRSADQLEDDTWVHEVNSVARLQQQEGFVTVFDVGVCKASGKAYIAMELLEGETLAARLTRGPMHWRRALWIAQRIAGALDASHALDPAVIHCDLKPDNIFLEAPTGRVRVIDWGIATFRAGGRRRAPAAPLLNPDAATRPVQPRARAVRPSATPIFGTPGYVSMEVLEGDTPGPGADTFALGVLLFRCISGRLPQRLPKDLEPRTPSASDSTRRAQALNDATLKHDLLQLEEQVPGLPNQVTGLVASLLAGPEERFDGKLEPEIRRVFNLPYGLPDRPYAGMDEFGLNRATLLAGRNEHIRLVRARLGPDAPALVIAGPSGCGKSSLAHAGVAATFDRELAEGRDGWRIHVINPSESERVRWSTEDESAPQSPWPETGVFLVIDRLEELVQEDQRASRRSAVDSQAPAVPAQPIRPKRWDTKAQEAFAELALELAKPDPERRGLVIDGEWVPAGTPIRTVLSVRDDYLTRITAVKPLARFVEKNLMLVRAPDQMDAGRIVRTPAEAFGYEVVDPHGRVETEVAVHLHEDAGVLPLVQVALDAWWERCSGGGEDRVLHAEQWEGIEATMHAAANRTLHGLSSHERSVMQKLLVSLFDSRGSRKQIRIGNEGDPVRQGMIQRLLDQRVLRKREIGGRPHIEAMHESLAKWPKLAEWFEEAKDTRELSERVEQAARWWKRDGGPAEDLWEGERLRKAEKEVGRKSSAWGFMQASLRQERKQRWRRRRGQVAWIVFAVLVGAGAFALLWWNYQDDIGAAKSKLEQTKISHTREKNAVERWRDQMKNETDLVRRERDRFWRESEGLRKEAATITASLAAERKDVEKVRADYRRSIGEFEGELAERQRLLEERTKQLAAKTKQLEQKEHTLRETMADLDRGREIMQSPARFAKALEHNADPVDVDLPEGESDRPFKGPSGRFQKALEPREPLGETPTAPVESGADSAFGDAIDSGW